jgi:ribosomal protein S27AE
MDGLSWIPWVIIVPLVLWLVIGILILSWVYQDAESRGMSGVLWALIILVLNVIGLILYLIVRESRIPAFQRITRVCPKCGQVLSEDARFCPRCGKELA